VQELGPDVAELLRQRGEESIKQESVHPASHDHPQGEEGGGLAEEELISSESIDVGSLAGLVKQAETLLESWNFAEEPVNPPLQTPSVSQWWLNTCGEAFGDALGVLHGEGSPPIAGETMPVAWWMTSQLGVPRPSMPASPVTWPANSLAVPLISDQAGAKLSNQHTATIQAGVA
jgi:hypothetical protein